MKRKLILYFTLGYPDQNTLESVIDRISSDRVDYVEFGFPSKSPLYDGPGIKSTHRKALENYRDDDAAEIFKKMAAKKIKIFSLTYFSDVSNMLNDFLEFLSENGFSGLILPDLLVDFQERASEVARKIKDHGMELIPFFNPSTPDSVIQSVSGMTSSWIYYGLQPSTGINVPFDIEEVAERIKALLPSREINFGFGIRTVEQVKDLVRCGAHGIAIGTALIELLERKDLSGFDDFVTKMRGVLDEN